MYLGGNRRWVPLICLVFNLSGRCTLITFFLGQEDDSSVKSSENQEAQPVKRKRSNSKPEDVRLYN